MVAGSIRQVAILYSNNCMRICLARLNSHRGGHLNRFDSTLKTESTEYSVFLLYFVLLKQKFYSTHQYLASAFVRHICKWVNSGETLYPASLWLDFYEISSEKSNFSKRNPSFLHKPIKSKTLCQQILLFYP